MSSVYFGEGNYWPHATLQEGKALLLIARINAWKDVLEAIADYFKAMAAAEKQFGESMTKVQKSFQKVETEDFTSNFGGSLGGGLHDFSDFTKHAGHNHSELANLLETTVLKKISEMKKDFGKETSNMKQDIDKMQTNLRASREETLQMITTFEKLYRGLAMDGIQLGDPWLQEIKLKDRIQKNVKEENSFNDTMIEKNKELQKIDTTYSEQLKEILTEFSTVIHRQTNLQTETVNHLGHRLKLINPSQEYELYTKRSGLDDLTVWKSHFPEDASHIQYPFKGSPLLSVSKIGILKRQGRMIKGNWKDAFFVLTSCGYLHCFNSKTQIKSASKESKNKNQAPFSWTQNPAFAAQQKAANVSNPANNNPPSLKEAPPSPVKETNIIFDISEFVEDIAPVYSINIRGANVSAAAPGNISNYSFEVVVPPPSKGIFAKETRYVIRATSEEEMVDWFVAVKAKSQAHLITNLQAPNEPPPPFAANSGGNEEPVPRKRTFLGSFFGGGDETKNNQIQNGNNGHSIPAENVEEWTDVDLKTSVSEQFREQMHQQEREREHGHENNQLDDELFQQVKEGKEQNQTEKLENSNQHLTENSNQHETQMENSNQHQHQTENSNL